MGSVDAVVKHAARHDTRQMQARPADLEDLFRRYYVTGTDTDAETTTPDGQVADGG